MNEYYISTTEMIKEEINEDNETTYFIRGRISKNGKEWENCLFIWDGDMNGKDNI